MEIEMERLRGGRERKREREERERRHRERGGEGVRGGSERNGRRMESVTGEIIYMALVNISLSDLYCTQNQFIGRSRDCSSPVTSSGGGTPVA